LKWVRWFLIRTVGGISAANACLNHLVGNQPFWRKKTPEGGIFNIEKMGKQQPTAKNGFNFQKSIARERFPMAVSNCLALKYCFKICYGRWNIKCGRKKMRKQQATAMNGQKSIVCERDKNK